MTAVDYSVLDNPEASGRTFHPLRGWTDTPPGAVDYGITVADGVTCRADFSRWGVRTPPCSFSTAAARTWRATTTSRRTTTASARTSSSPTTGDTARPTGRPASIPCCPTPTRFWTGFKRPCGRCDLPARSTSWAVPWAATPPASWPSTPPTESTASSSRAGGPTWDGTLKG